MQVKIFNWHFDREIECPAVGLLFNNDEHQSAKPRQSPPCLAAEFFDRVYIYKTAWKIA